MLQILVPVTYKCLFSITYIGSYLLSVTTI